MRTRTEELRKTAPAQLSLDLRTSRTEAEIMQSIRAKGFKDLDSEEAELVARQTSEDHEDTTRSYRQ